MKSDPEKLKRSKTEETNATRDFFSNQAEEFRERFLYIIESSAADKYRYAWLESHSGIPAARWQNVLLEKQFPTMEMILFAAFIRPNFTYWLVHGVPQPPEMRDRPDPKVETILMGPTVPREESYNVYKAHREWMKEKRKSKAAAKKTLPD